MILLTAATDLEMDPLRGLLAGKGAALLVSGMGAVETVLSLTRFLAGKGAGISGVINFGVCGGFAGVGLQLLDLCLAGKEVFGDFGICAEGEILPFNKEHTPVRTEFLMDEHLFAKAGRILAANAMPCTRGTFVTVNCVSGTEERGRILRDRHQAICENMEGAAVARVCEFYQIPCLEVRCVSNWVEDRDTGGWRLAEAADKCARAVACLLAGLEKDV